MESLIGVMCMDKHIKLKFFKKGLLTLVVDKSKIGYQKYGVPVSGPMDMDSADKANWLVGNEAGTPVFEINILGPKILFEDPCQMAITGADISPSVDDIKVNMYETLSLHKGAILQFGKLTSGCRAYMAIRGKWKVTNWIIAGSPINVSSLKSLSSIDIEAPKSSASKRKIKKPTISQGLTTLNAMRGPEYELLSKEVRKKLFNTIFKLLPASNRMGYRLTPELPKIDISIISSGVVPGTLQITQEGFPILLMRDGPATGGYVRALNVISDDMSKLGQLKAGDTIKFILASNYL